jgi:hypothetical protein
MQRVRRGESQSLWPIGSISARLRVRGAVRLATSSSAVVSQSPDDRANARSDTPNLVSGTLTLRAGPRRGASRLFEGLLEHLVGATQGQQDPPREAEIV